MKVYWAQGVGAVITSANLTGNALGESRLHEVGIRISDTTIDIEALLHSIKPYKVTPKTLWKLDKEHANYRKRNPFSSSGKQKNFLEVANEKKTARRWKLLNYYEDCKIDVAPSIRLQAQDPPLVIVGKDNPLPYRIAG